MFTTNSPQSFISSSSSSSSAFFGLISECNINGAALDPNNVENLLNG